MPYVNLKITRDGVTPEQKARIIAEFTDTLVRVLGKKPEHTHIVIDEVDVENWGFAGVPTSVYRANAARASGRGPE
jgi:4-oxalocrotonate tautomerase